MTSQAVKVAYIGIKGLPACAGADRVVEAIVTRVPAHGISPTVYCDRERTPAGTSIPDVNLVCLPALPGKHLRATTLDLLAGLHAIFLGDYDLIHLHNAEAAFILPLLRLRYRVVSTHHAMAYLRAKWNPAAKAMMRLMDGPFMKFSNAVTFVSAKDARLFQERYHKEVTHIPNGVGTEYAPDRARAEVILNQHKLTWGGYMIFVAGRIEPTKGAHLAIEAVNCMQQDMPLLVLGDDSHVPEYHHRLREIAGKRTCFQPLIEDAATVFGLMAGARGLIFPSSLESMSMVLLEAAWLGVPVVCSDLEENRLVLQEYACYFSSGELDSLVERLQWFLAHPGEVAQIAREAQSRVRERFSWDNITARYIEVYRKVVSRSS